MVKFIDDYNPVLKQVKVYDLATIGQYLQVRYQVFVNELGRSIVGEFNTDDLISKHYLLKGEYPIGAARVTYRENHIAEIGRVAVLPGYRKHGYGTMMVNQVTRLIKTSSTINTIRLFAEDNKVEFYKKLGFVEKGIVFFDNYPLIDMVTTVNK